MIYFLDVCFLWSSTDNLHNMINKSDILCSLRLLDLALWIFFYLVIESLFEKEQRNYVQKQISSRSYQDCRDIKNSSQTNKERTHYRSCLSYELDQTQACRLDVLGESLDYENCIKGVSNILIYISVLPRPRITTLETVCTAGEISKQKSKPKATVTDITTILLTLLLILSPIQT